MARLDELPYDILYMICAFLFERMDNGPWKFATRRARQQIISSLSRTSKALYEPAQRFLFRRPCLKGPSSEASRAFMRTVIDDPKLGRLVRDINFPRFRTAQDQKCAFELTIRWHIADLPEGLRAGFSDSTFPPNRSAIMGLFLGLFPNLGTLRLLDLHASYWLARDPAALKLYHCSQIHTLWIDLRESFFIDDLAALLTHPSLRVLGTRQMQFREGFMLPIHCSPIKSINLAESCLNPGSLESIFQLFKFLESVSYEWNYEAGPEELVKALGTLVSSIKTLKLISGIDSPRPRIKSIISFQQFGALEHLDVHECCFLYKYYKDPKGYLSQPEDAGEQDQSLLLSATLPPSIKTLVLRHTSSKMEEAINHLSELCSKNYPKLKSVTIWIAPPDYSHLAPDLQAKYFEYCTVVFEQGRAAFGKFRVAFEQTGVEYSICNTVEADL